MIRKVGLSMRVVSETRYVEHRDAISQDWTDFLFRNFPFVQWVPIPNLGASSKDFAKDWGLQGIILTGGNDIGESDRRDETEYVLVDFALRKKLPILGVCRGMQLLNSFLGGSIARGASEVHSGKKHKIKLLTDISRALPANSSVEVNSFHNFVLDQRGEGVEPFAHGEDGTIEGFRYKKNVFGIQWHPERSANLNELDRELFKLTFGWSDR